MKISYNNTILGVYELIAYAVMQDFRICTNLVGKVHGAFYGNGDNSHQEKSKNELFQNIFIFQYYYEMASFEHIFITSSAL